MYGRWLLVMIRVCCTSLPELAPEHERQQARDEHRSTGQNNAQQQGRHRLCAGRTEGQHGRDATGLR
jgi:hypothetical protein